VLPSWPRHPKTDSRLSPTIQSYEESPLPPYDEAPPLWMSAADDYYIPTFALTSGRQRSDLAWVAFQSTSGDWLFDMATCQ
jgi:hypothetical protein